MPNPASRSPSPSSLSLSSLVREGDETNGITHIMNDIDGQSAEQPYVSAPSWERLNHRMSVSEASRKIVSWSRVHAPYEDRLTAARRLLVCLAAQADDPQSLVARVLDLSGLKITELPDCFDCFPNLGRLLLNLNRLTELPLSICELEELKHLNLSGNRFNEIPPHLDNLCILEWLDLTDNNKFFTVPANIVHFGGQGSTRCQVLLLSRQVSEQLRAQLEAITASKTQSPEFTFFDLV